MYSDHYDQLERLYSFREPRYFSNILRVKNNNNDKPRISVIPVYAQNGKTTAITGLNPDLSMTSQTNHNGCNKFKIKCQIT